jgi:hypothetical protein
MCDGFLGGLIPDVYLFFNSNMVIFGFSDMKPIL